MYKINFKYEQIKKKRKENVNVNQLFTRVGLK